MANATPSPAPSGPRSERPQPWLIAAWPGMGNVAVIAAGYLVQALEMKELAELPSRGHFDINEVEVKKGVIEPPQLPRGRFFRWSGRGGARQARRAGGAGGAGRDVLVFIGESQPAIGAYEYAHELVSKAMELGVERIVTFASMASALHPSEDPKVFGVATSAQVLDELERAEVAPLEDGQIGGLNGVVLGAALDRGLDGMCLLGEIPYFAAAVPNPKAARAVLSVFSILAGLEISLETLNQYAEAMDRAILEAMKKMEQQAEEGGEESLGLAPEPETPEPEPPTSPASATGEARPPQGAEPPPPKLDYATRNRIESLFQQARTDRHKAVKLKEELDRLGIFKLYEDRFLDLFRRAE